MSTLLEQKSNDLIKFVQSYEPQIKLALPKHLDPQRMTRVFMTEVRKNPKLALCDRASFMGAIIVCAQLGLEPGNGLGHSYLIPYGKEAQMQIGFQGMIELVERNGKVTIDADVVYEKDNFDYIRGTEAYIKHKPYFGKEPRGEIIAAYAIAKYVDGRTKFIVLPISEIEKARSHSQRQSKGPWDTHYDQMAKKTAVKRLFKYLPKSADIAKAIEIEDRLEEGNQNLANEFKDFKMEHNILDIDLEEDDKFQPENEEQYNKVIKILGEKKISPDSTDTFIEPLKGVPMKDIESTVQKLVEAL